MGNIHSGRKKNPQHLRELKGENHLERHNHDEPKPPDGPVEVPSGLSPGAVVVWERLAPVCLHMGTLTAGDVEPFKVLCELQATFDMAAAQKNAPGFAPFTMSEDYNGAMKVGLHAAIKLEKEVAGALRPFYDYFGLNAFARAKIRVKKPKPASKWAALAG